MAPICSVSQLISCTDLQADNSNMWLMGPELGEFIAGIGSENDQHCMTDETRWLYASRASASGWKSDDRSLTVKCYEPEGKFRVINLFFTLFNNVKNVADDIAHSHSEEDFGTAEIGGCGKRGSQSGREGRPRCLSYAIFSSSNRRYDWQVTLPGRTRGGNFQTGDIFAQSCTGFGVFFIPPPVCWDVCIVVFVGP